VTRNPTALALATTGAHSNPVEETVSGVVSEAENEVSDKASER
jgi:hypothetical protein